MIRVAILGAGIGREHLAAYRQLPDVFDVAWMVDRDAARIATLDLPPMTRVAQDAEEALSDPSVDLVDICLPPHLHVEMTLAVLRSGKHVVCEKPLATSLAEVDEIARAAARAQRQVFPVFQYRWGPSLTQLQHLTGTGIAGKPYLGVLETHWSRGAEYYAVPWRGTWAGEMGGAVLGHAIHGHDLLTHVMGPVRALSAFAATRVNPIETEDCASISMEMENGALATSSITLGAARNETRLRFVFEHLTATSGTAPYAPGAVPWDFSARDPSRQDEIDKALATAPKEDVGFAGFFADVARAVGGEPNQAVTLAEGRRSIELVTAIYHAARSGERVTLPLPADHALYKGWAP